MASKPQAAVFRVTQSGAEAIATDMSHTARDLRAIILSEFRGAAPELESIFEAHAPEDTGLLKEELDVRISTGGLIRATVHSPVRDPDSGFAYTDVTRFGHRGPIRPRRAKTLRYYRYGRWNIASETAGHHPPSDWVENAAPEADREAARIAERVGRIIYTRLL